MFMSIIIDAFSVVKRHDEKLKDSIVLEQVCWQEFVRLITHNVPDELQVWKSKGKADAFGKDRPLMSPTPRGQFKDTPPDKFDLDWRVKKSEDALLALENMVQKISNKVITMENMDDGQNKF
ncbi:uncharacterized protein [Amphiura filiformis]|uniref:uncharacterized protein n=1 Tax=Amphiura filiformis TaxID=82378 RepID=UPI003B22373B